MTTDETKRFDIIFGAVLAVFAVATTYAYFSEEHRKDLQMRRSSFSYDCQQILGIPEDICDRLESKHIK